MEPFCSSRTARQSNGCRKPTLPTASGSPCGRSTPRPMHQLAIWTMLEDMGLGASLQHYNPLIDEAVRSAWSLDPEWELVAQMPFGAPAGEPGPKEFQPLEGRVLVFD